MLLLRLMHGRMAWLTRSRALQWNASVSYRQCKAWKVCETDTWLCDSRQIGYAVDFGGVYHYECALDAFEGSNLTEDAFPKLPELRWLLIRGAGVGIGQQDGRRSQHGSFLPIHMRYFESMAHVLQPLGKFLAICQRTYRKSTRSCSN